MKLKFLFYYLSYALPAFAFSLLSKLFSFLSKKCAALASSTARLLKRQQDKLESMKQSYNAKRQQATQRVASDVKITGNPIVNFIESTLDQAIEKTIDQAIGLPN